MELPEFFKDMRRVSFSIVGALGALATIWGITDRLATDAELEATKNQIVEKQQLSEDKIIAEVRSESADIRAVIIEDMESRLDNLSYAINIAESQGKLPSEADIIKRNNLDRRIKKLKAEEINEDSN